MLLLRSASFLRCGVLSRVQTSQQNAGLDEQNARAPHFPQKTAVTRKHIFHARAGARAFCSLSLACCQPAWPLLKCWQDRDRHLSRLNTCKVGRSLPASLRNCALEEAMVFATPDQSHAMGSVPPHGRVWLTR